MSTILRALAAIALLGVVAGCAAWTPNVDSDPMNNPPIYEESPSD